MNAGPAAPPIAPPPVPADVGIVAALSIEINPLIARLSNVRKYSSERHTIVEGELSGKIVAVIIAGPGRKAARRGTQLLLGGHRPQWILSAGFGGALNPDLHRNDLVFGTEVIDPEGNRLTIDLTLHDQESTSRVVTGAIVTSDAIVRTAAEKAALRARTGADVVDMESSAVAAVCSERNVRFLAIRVISDEAGTDLPAEIATILGRSGGYRVGAALGAIWRRPSSLKDMWALREHAVAAADRISRFVPGVLKELS
ncbi:MAG: nucleoside phosphorylase [Planctomycetota bacterium]|nr:nucleoside phosphorylase [Planctomycetota bacterium]